jgi:gliding motility-associated-like protein
MKAFLIFGLFLGLLFFKPTPSFCTFPRQLSIVDTCRIPSLITPNDDGKNDEFIVPCIPNNASDNKSELFIFNEWGERVAYFMPYLNDWTGTYSSKPLPDGTYFYIFKLTPTVNPQRGYITIFR